MPPGSMKFQGKDIVVFNQMDGMSTQSQRQDLSEKKAAWMENLQPIAANNLVCTPAAAAAIASLASSGETIAKMFYFDFGQSTDFIVCFCVSGAAYTVANPSGTIVKWANAGTFSTTPDVTQWALQRILIADPTAGYSTYDTHAFVQFGGVSPNIEVTAGGTGYTAGATVAISGGSGSGATATATAVGGVITAITLTNAGTGYAATDTLTVTITPVSGGSGATASAHVWPNVTPNPTTIAVFQGRVWLAQANVLNYTGTGASYGGIGYDDFISGDAAGSITIQDTDLTHRITALRALNNYLFIFGDSSIKQIGNISVSGSSTNFTITTLSSDQGTTFRDSIASYNRLVLFANETAVFAVFGSSVEKISDDMDGIFRLTNFSQLPVAAVSDINNIHCYLLLVKYEDPAAGARSLMLAFMNKKWFVISQSDTLKYIVTGIINSFYNVYGTSGADITPLLASATTPVNIKLQTSLTSHGAPFEAKRTFRYAVAQSVGASSSLQLTIESERSTPSPQNITYNISNVLNFINNSQGALQFVNNGGGNLNFITNAAGFHYQRGNTNGQGGVYIGMTLTGAVEAFTLNSMMLEYGEGAAFGSEQVAYAATL
jgi:hypothetical protein